MERVTIVVMDAGQSTTNQLILRKFPRWCRVFLRAYRENGCVTTSARFANIGRRRVYEYADHWPRFKAMMQDAYEQHLDLCELEAVRRGRIGVDEPIVYKGQVMGRYVDQEGKECNPGPEATFIPTTIKKYSDVLLLAVLRANRSKYRNSQPLAPTRTSVKVVNVQVQGQEKFLERAAAYDTVFEGLAGSRNGKPMDAAHANGKANGVHVKPGD